MDLYSYKEEKIQIYRKGEQEYVSFEAVQFRRYILSKYLPLLSNNSHENVSDYESYLSKIKTHTYNSDWKREEGIIIDEIARNLYAIEKNNQSFFFIRILKKLSNIYDSLILDLKESEFDPEQEYSIETVRKREAKILMSLALFYSFSDKIAELSIQLDINILDIINRNALEFLFDIETLNKIPKMEDDKDAHHPLLSNPSTMGEQLGLLQHWGIIEYLQDKYKYNDRQLAILISAIINKSEQNIRAELGMKETKDRASNNPKNKEKIEFILSKIDKPNKK